MDHSVLERGVSLQVSGAPELVVVVPTFNERDNIRPLLDRLGVALAGLRWEAIFVDDDSPDGTADLLRQIAKQMRHVRVIQRIGRRGLASACVEGVLSSASPYFAVIDADLQHDEAILPLMLRALKEDGLDIVVGSRYIEGGDVAGLDRKRRTFSWIAGRAARLLIKADLNDPMSGYFIMRREVFDECVRNLSQQGFKILLDLFASAPRPLRFAEVPYQFRYRTHGISKLDSMAVWEYGMLLADKLVGGIIPVRFLSFGLIGALGLLVHLTVLRLALFAGLGFAASQTCAVVVAMTFNFTLNNAITYRDRRLTGWRFVWGLLSFGLICSIGAFANIGVAVFVFSEKPIWWLAGMAGALIGAVWNYALSGFFTWKPKRQGSREGGPTKTASRSRRGSRPKAEPGN
jgi:dolichol-phosphate mannosyltransferase